MTDTPDMVEAAARIIDPSSWRVMDDYLADTLRKYKGQNIGYDPEQFKHKESMAKAREIIAAMQPHIAKASGEPVAWMYQFTTAQGRVEPPVYMTEKRDWAEKHSDWKETALVPAEALAKAYEAGQIDMRERAAVIDCDLRELRSSIRALRTGGQHD